jgi:predicted acyltransferase
MAVATQPIQPVLASTSPTALAVRLGSIDAYRGFVMLLMMAEILRLSKVAEALPSSEFWKFLAFHQTHVPWAGCSLHDLIQPSFSFLVGVSLPFSIVSRRAKGGSFGGMFLHAVWRAIILVLLGVFLRSMGREQTNWTFEDTLSQIGFGYVPLFLLGFTKQRWQWAALIAILVGYWGAFALYPLPPNDFDYAAVGVPADWPYTYGGFAAHWNKNSNLAWAFDTWFLNLFPRAKPFLFNAGGYATLSFVPTLATMILGLIAGGWLRAGVHGSGFRVQEADRRQETGDRGQQAAANRKSKIPRLIFASSAPAMIARFVFAGVVLITLGLLAHGAMQVPYAKGWENVVFTNDPLCPCVKRIWTPSWTLYGGGWCFILLAGFYALIDAARLSSWSFPLRVIGANSIAAYVLAHGPDRFIRDSLKVHFGSHWMDSLGAAYQPLLIGGAVLAIEWLILYWLYRQRIHIRV